MAKVVTISPDENVVEGNRVIPKVSRLNTVDDVKHEAGKLFRRAVRGDVAPGDARHLGTLLTLVLSASRAGETDARIAALEKRITEAKAGAKAGAAVTQLVRPRPVA